MTMPLRRRGLAARLLLVATAWAGALLSASATSLAAQVTPPVKPPVVSDTGRRVQPPAARAPGDTVKKKTKADSIAALGRDQPLVVWDPPDSTMQELMARKGYRRVQYQGDVVHFDQKTGELRMTGKPSAVQRDETILVGDTIIYSDSLKNIAALGDTVKLRDPTQKDADDFVAHGRINYDLESRSGTVGAFATSVESGGQRLFIAAEGGTIFADSAVTGKHIVYAADGSFTYCDLAEPHFHFTTKQMKFVSQNIMVARPGVLYIGEVPVFWIPFFFQDVRSGRRSGLLTPNFGIAELLRNSPSYRRQLNNLGYFFALNDYMDSEVSFDWRSDANGTFSDRGFLRGNADFRYRWINRFIVGRVSIERLVYASGNKNLSISINHSQDFSKQTRFTSNLNWTQNTQIQQATTTNPFAATATILSQLNYQTKLGPSSVQIGGTRRQFPGRTQVETDFPSLSITTSPLSVGPITWTPGGRIAVSSKSGLDQGLQFPFAFSARPGGGTDSTRIKASRRNITGGFESPLKIFDFQWQNSFTFADEQLNYPEELLIQNVNNPADSSRRVYARRFQTSFDWNTSFNLPRFFQGTWNLSPTISINNVDPQGGLLVRSTRSAGNWVAQTKRLSYGMSSSPTLYAQFPGIGPIARFRHTIAPSFNYSYSPASNVSDAFLSALGRTRLGYLGALAQNRVSMGLTTDLEGKLRSSSDSAPGAGRKVRLLSLNFSSLSWDFIRADTARKAGCKQLCGLAESNFSISARSDLVPGLDFRTNYSLFQGDPLSDTATFKPFRTDLGATFSLNGKSGILAVIGKLFGARGGNLDDAVTGARKNSIADDVLSAQKQQLTAAGSNRRNPGLNIPEGRGWSLNLNYNATRQRPPRGGTVVVNDPATLCESQRVLGDLVYNACLINAQTAPPAGTTTNQTIGSPIFISPPTQNVTSNLTFNVTRNWSAQWSTSYDVERSRFASQQIGLQRQLHDWTTTFSFNQSPNGAFSFSFFIALKAQPALKFNYDKSSYRSSGF